MSVEKALKLMELLKKLTGQRLLAHELIVSPMLKLFSYNGHKSEKKYPIEEKLRRLEYEAPLFVQ